MHFQCNAYISKKEAHRWERDKQSMVNTWQVLGKKYGAVALAVSLARGSTCHENTKVRNKYAATKEDLIK